MAERGEASPRPFGRWRRPRCALVKNEARRIRVVADQHRELQRQPLGPGVHGPGFELGRGAHERGLVPGAHGPGLELRARSEDAQRRRHHVRAPRRRDDHGRDGSRQSRRRGRRQVHRDDAGSLEDACDEGDRERSLHLEQRARRVAAGRKGDADARLEPPPAAGRARVDQPDWRPDDLRQCMREGVELRAPRHPAAHLPHRADGVEAHRLERLPREGVDGDAHDRTCASVQ